MPSVDSLVPSRSIIVRAFVQTLAEVRVLANHEAEMERMDDFNFLAVYSSFELTRRWF
jgi:hypothetical protein